MRHGVTNLRHMIMCIGTTPAAQRVMLFPKLQLDAVNRATMTLDGGAGKSVNVAKVLKALGARPFATGFLGGDRGDYLRNLLEVNGIAQQFVTVAPRTRQCITVIDESSGTQTELVEESQAVEPANYEELLGIIRDRVSACRAVVMSGTITPGAPNDFYRRCVEVANAAGAFSVVDARGLPLSQALEARPGLVKPNRQELAASVGRELPDETAVFDAMRELCENGAQQVVVTAGSKPTIAFDGESFWRITPPKIAPLNPIGSGDAFTAGLVWGLLRG